MNQNFNKFLTKMSIPKLAEFFILITFLDENGFSMLLNKPIENSSGPFFGMEIIELRSAFGLWLTDIVIIEWIF